MSARVKKIMEDRASAWEAMKGIHDAADAEGRTELTAEERAAWDKAEADVERLGDEARREERFAAFGEDISKPVVPSELRGASSPGEPSVEDSDEKIEGAFRSYIRGGMRALSAEQRSLMEVRAQSAATNTAGGYLVPAGYWERISETLKAFGGLMSAVNVIETATGNVFPWPNNNDTGNTGRILSENTQLTETDVVFGTRQLNAWTYTSDTVLASLQLLQDAAFDVDAFVTRKLGVRIARAVSADIAVGSGTSKPTGIALAPTVGVTGSTGSTLTASYNNMIDLVHSVDAAYRAGGNCRFAMHDLTVAILRKLVDSQNRPLWIPDLSSPDGDRFMGYPVLVDNGIPVMAANAFSILFGDFNAGYVLRKVHDVTVMRLTERYADFLQVGFLGFARFDGLPDDPAAIRAYKNSAT